VRRTQRFRLLNAAREGWGTSGEEGICGAGEAGSLTHVDSGEETFPTGEEEEVAGFVRGKTPPKLFGVFVALVGGDGLGRERLRKEEVRRGRSDIRHASDALFILREKATTKERENILTGKINAWRQCRFNKKGQYRAHQEGREDASKKRPCSPPAKK